jgi:hypothetical protein
MSRESFVFLLGIIILVTPFLGIPGEWKQWILPVAGLFVAIVGYRMRRAAFLRSIATATGERRSDAFVENEAPDEGLHEEGEMSRV